MYCAVAETSGDVPHCDWERNAVRLGITQARGNTGNVTDTGNVMDTGNVTDTGNLLDKYASTECEETRGPETLSARKETLDDETSPESRIATHRKLLRASAKTGKRGKKQTSTPKTTWPMEQLLFDHGVDLAFFGHVHSYTRFFPVFDLAVKRGANDSFDTYHQPAATVHVTTGSGGNKEMVTIHEARKDSGGGVPVPVKRGRCDSVNGKDAASWCAFVSGFAPDKEKHETSDFTFSRITVFGGERLIWEQISAGDPSVSSSLDETQVIDAFTVETTTHGSFKRLER